MIKTFVGIDEAAAMLGSNYEGLRQALELGLGWQLPAYVYAGSRPFLAQPIGPGVEFTAGHVHDVTSATTTIPGFGTLTSADFQDLEKIGDKLGQVAFSGLPQSETGIPTTLKLKGYFRVAPHALSDAAREHSVGMVEVAPESWWSKDSPVEKFDSGVPAVRLMLLPSKQPSYSELPELSDLRFKIADVEALTASRTDPQRDRLEGKPLDERERTSLLRIIGALAVMAKVPERGATASIEAQLQEIGFSTPAEATIRKVMKLARSLEPDNPQ